jgi:protein-S-isoprenylcysteine O-methyltransferase Ste14
MINDNLGNSAPTSDRLSFWEKGAAWVLGQLFLIVLILFVPAHIGGLPVMPNSLNGISTVAGIVIGVVGIILLMLSGMQLGSNLTIFPCPKTAGSLIQGGIYSIVRHPIYSSVLLSALGWVLFRTSLPALLLTFILGWFFDHKARREEVWLVEKYPEYRTYQKHVRKLIPWVY